MAARPLTQDVVRMIAERFAALADETRIRIMICLRERERNVSALSQELGVPQPSVSKHLAVLRRAGFVEVRRRGTQCFCCVSDESIFDMCDIVCSGVMQHQMALGRALGFEITMPAPGHMTKKRKAATTAGRVH